MKYNFSMMAQETNPFLGLMLEINDAVFGMFGYVFLAFIFGISFYIISKRTQDVGKSGLMALHICVLLAFLLFYAGKVAGLGTYPLISNLVMYAMLMLEVFGLGTAYFLRMKGM